MWAVAVNGVLLLPPYRCDTAGLARRACRLMSGEAGLLRGDELGRSKRTSSCTCVRTRGGVRGDVGGRSLRLVRLPRAWAHANRQRHTRAQHAEAACLAAAGRCARRIAHARSAHKAHASRRTRGYYLRGGGILHAQRRWSASAATWGCAPWGGAARHARGAGACLSLLCPFLSGFCSCRARPPWLVSFDTQTLLQTPRTLYKTMDGQGERLQGGRIPDPSLTLVASTSFGSPPPSSMRRSPVVGGLSRARQS